ncbi:MAG: PrsW family intramembrane metalloprotease [Candidatus Aminicenantes bacterium]|nr:MAG: PrsW family intramembrane metalloprotease [Candidatus Aminicenantes bacterium]
MTIWLVLSGIIAPAVFWSGYFYYKDRFKPEPIRYLGITYIFGLATAFACIQFFRLLPLIGIPEDPSVLMETNRLKFFFYSLGVIGFVEELFKMLPFLFIIYKFKAFDEKIDGIIYASTIALGFASYENFRYLAYLDGFELFGRAFASPLTHSIFASIWGFTIGTARVSNKSILKATFIGIILAALIHGLFDFFTTSPALRIAASITILIIWVWRIRVLEKLGRRKN